MSPLGRSGPFTDLLVLHAVDPGFSPTQLPGLLSRQWSSHHLGPEDQVDKECRAKGAYWLYF